MRFLPIVILFGSFAVPASASTPMQETITRNELATADPAVMHRKLRDLVWELVEQKDFREEASGKGQLNVTTSLSSLQLRTKITPGYTRGLCQRQLLSIRLALNSGPGASPGYRANAFFTHTTFHFFQPPSNVYAASWYKMVPNPECEALAANTNFFHAENEQSAHDGYLAFLQAKEAIRAGSLEVECDEIVRDIYKTNCRPDVDAIDQKVIDSIGPCSEIKSESCFKIVADRQSREVEVQMGGSPWHPVRVRVGFFASVTTAAQ